VINTAFEQWQSEPLVHFDLAYAATAWKWIHPAVRYPRAAALPKPGGHLAVWAADAAFPSGFDPIFTEIQDDYAHIGESRIPWPPEPTPETVTADEMESSGYFDSVHTSLYVWPVRYDAHRYLACFNTFSGHIAMDATKRDYLYRAIRARLQNRPDGSLTRHWAATLTVGRRR
jgi:hypothetical protein